MEDEKAPPADDISRDELQDLADVALASSVPESMFLTGVLEDAGIPAVTRSDNLWGLSGGINGTVRILVPRVMLERAKNEIDKARNDADQRRVENAFTPQAIAEESFDTTKDPLLERMFLIRELQTDTERNQNLEPFIASWLKDGMSAAQMAKYLAAAGLSIEQSEALVEATKLKYADDINTDRERRKAQGIMLLVVGLFLTLGTVVAFIIIGGGVIVLTYGALITGLIFYYQSSRPLPTIKANPAPDDKAQQ